MGATLKLGTVAGVKIGVHWSALGTVVLLFALVTSGLAHAYPDQSTVAHVASGLVAAVLFMASLFTHEIAHAVVAKRQGLEVEGITLWLLGGVSSIRGEASRPRADFAIAIVGPAASLASALVFAALAWFLAFIGAGPLWVAVASYLAVINVLLAAFNLIPAAPLDGGRILRAALWAARGDRVSAAVWAARAGRGFGMFLLLLGGMEFLFGYSAGLWWLMLGLFILLMAGAEERQAQTGAALAGLRVRDVMTQDPDTASGDLPVEAFLHDYTLVRRHSSFPLLDERGRFEGLITFDRLIAVPARERPTTTLREAACPPGEVPVADPGEPVTDLLPRLSAAADRRALVFSGDRLVGIVTPSDISRAVALHLPRS
ncbi:site-2 protease family protein [Glycomyces sp. YM15]|uniref:site-2 protease family protein n=1 Tax=Glycomyces sp. YM15 TaxID=2800446 RepID=UPI0019663B58|nr:site-2 protease family protein [Glycomyces sp. YM15]